MTLEIPGSRAAVPNRADQSGAGGEAEDAECRDQGAPGASTVPGPAGAQEVR